MLEPQRGQFIAQLYRAAGMYLVTKPRRYATFAEVLGSLTATQLEYSRRLGGTLASPILLSDLQRFTQDFYREQVAPYEDEKIEENGDVYP